MKKTIRFAIIINFILAFANFPLAGAEEITWIHADFPPSSIVSGSDKGAGLCDRVEKLLQENLPEYEHVEKIANYNRIMTEFKEGSKVICTALIKNPEREKFIQYAELSQISFPNGAIFLKSMYPKFKEFVNTDGEMDFENLVASSNFKIGISSGRKYGNVIDEVLNRYKNSDSIHTRSGVDLLKGLIRMMQKGRVDIILGYPQEYKYFARRFDIKNDIMFLPIKDMPEYLPCWIGAPRTPWGKEIIGKINEIVLKKRHTPEYLQFYENWIYEDNIARYRQIAKRVFGQ